MKRKIFVGLLSLALIVFMAACGNKTETPAVEKPQENVAEEVKNEEAKETQAEEPAVEVDFTKEAESYLVEKEEALKVLGLEKAPASVIALSWIDNLFLIDAGANVLALPDNHHIPEDILEKYKAFTDHDGKLDYGVISELKPELIIASEKQIAEDAELKKIVDENGIIVTQIPDRNTYDEVLKMIGTIGAAYGDVEVAKTSIAGYLERVNDALALGKGVEGKNVAVINVTKDGEFVLGTGNFVESLLEKLGLNNVASNLTLEAGDNFGFAPSPGMAKIAEAKPDALVLMVRIKGEKELREQKINELIESIKKEFGEDSNLVKEEKYEVIDHHGLIIACPLAISGLENVASIVFE